MLDSRFDRRGEGLQLVGRRRAFGEQQSFDCQRHPIGDVVIGAGSVQFSGDLRRSQFRATAEAFLGEQSSPQNQQRRHRRGASGPGHQQANHDRPRQSHQHQDHEDHHGTVWSRIRGCRNEVVVRLTGQRGGGRAGGNGGGWRDRDRGRRCHGGGHRCRSRFVLLRFDTGVATIRSPAPGSGFEHQPAESVEPHLGPRVGVLATHRVRALTVALSGSESDGDARGESDGPRHGGEGGGELFAIARTAFEEVEVGVVALERRHIQRVGEVVAEERLQIDGRLIPGGRSRGDVAGDVSKSAHLVVVGVVQISR